MDTEIVGQFESVRGALGALVRDESERMETGLASDSEVLETLRAAGQLRDLADALLIAATDRIETLSQGPRDERLTTRIGERTTLDAVRAVTRCSSRSAREIVRAAAATHRDMSLTSGELLPSQFPELSAALRDGAIGMDGLLAATGPLVTARGRIRDAVIEAADAALAASARGTMPSEDGSGDVGERVPAMDADDVHKLAGAWVAYADPDGAEPQEGRALRKRGLRVGRARDGLVSITGHLLPDVAAQFTKQCDAINNPRTKTTSDDPALDDDEDLDGGADGDAPADDVGEEPRVLPGDERTSEQKLHDAFAAILGIAARSAESPRVGGAAPIVTLTMTERDFSAGTGWAHQDSHDAPASWMAARQAACNGQVQRVVHDENGRILHIEITDRVFNAAQRRAIIARDRECVILGCHTRATWCEIHHVHEHACGGATCTSNGVLLCWYHHRTLGKNGWEVRMRDGMPEVRGPRWWDPHQRWRGTNSPLASNGPPGG